MNILVDTNVLLDVGLQRSELLSDSEAVFRWCAAHPGRVFIAWHSLSNVYYVMRKQRGEEPSREFLAILLEIFTIPGAGTAAAKSALRLPMSDFEDALQVAAALEAGADLIVTRDANDYANALIPARSPVQFLVSPAP